MNNKTGEEKKKSYRNFQEDFLILLEEGFRTAGRITKREFDRIAETARDRLERKYGKEKVDDFSNRVKNNWQEMVDRIQDTRARFENEDSFRKGKEIAAQVLDGIAAAIKRAAENLEASLSDKVTYHAGQVVDKGAYLCVSCKKIQEIKRRRKLAPCEECGGSEFRLP
jgi:septation ring formation regulator EzrA